MPAHRCDLPGVTMSGLLPLRPGSIREVGDEAAGRGPERNDNSCPQCTDCVRMVHFLRDLAKPVLEADSHAKVQMRQKVRGLRSVEQSILEHRRASPAGPVPAPPSEATLSDTVAVGDLPPVAGAEDPAGDVVLDYCAAIRGILNDDQGGPLDPPGLRMAGALDEVRQSIGRNLAAKKGGSRRRN